MVKYFWVGCLDIYKIVYDMDTSVLLVIGKQ